VEIGKIEFNERLTRYTSYEVKALQQEIHRLTQEIWELKRQLLELRCSWERDRCINNVK